MPNICRVENCLLIGNGAYGIAADTGNGKVILLGTGFYDNTSGEVSSNITLFEPVPRTTLTGDPFVDAANDDFRLKPGMTDLLGSGWPGAYLDDGQLTAWTGHPDIGAVQQVVRPVINPMMGGP